jgi:hypothetical protein
MFGLNFVKTDNNKEYHYNLKTTSGSHSGLDASLQAKKQAQNLMRQSFKIQTVGCVPESSDLGPGLLSNGHHSPYIVTVPLTLPPVPRHL